VSKFVTNEQQRGAVLNKIRRTVLKEDIVQICYELRLQVGIEELILEIIQAAPLYEKAMFLEYTKYLKTLLTPEILQTQRNTSNILL
jgi:hypothetical protein